MENKLVSSGNSMMGFYVPYIRMKGLVAETFINTPYATSENIDIYIDMNSLCKELYFHREPTNGAEEIVSSALNLCAHYRHYFSTRHHTNTRFFIIYSDNYPEYCRSIIPDYGKKDNAARMKRPNIYNMVAGACLLMNDLCSYLPDIYFMTTEEETALYIMYSLWREQDYRTKNNVPAMIISKDPLTSLIFTKFNDIAFLRPRKYEAKDISTIITTNTVMRNIVLQSSANIRYHQDLDIGDIVLLYSLIGVPSRSVKPICDSLTALKIISAHKHGVPLMQAIDDQRIITTRLDINMPVLDFNAQLINLTEKLSLDVDRYQMSKNRLCDPEWVKMVNNERFRYCPIMLDKL